MTEIRHILFPEDCHNLYFKTIVFSAMVLPSATSCWRSPLQSSSRVMLHRAKHVVKPGVYPGSAMNRHSMPWFLRYGPFMDKRVVLKVCFSSLFPFLSITIRSESKLTSCSCVNAAKTMQNNKRFNKY